MKKLTEDLLTLAADKVDHDAFTEKQTVVLKDTIRLVGKAIEAESKGRA